MFVVSGSPFVNIHFTAYGSESDPGPMPVPHNAPIEGYPHPGNRDRHVLVLDRDNCWLYELYHSYPQKDGSWKADSAAVWDLLNDEQRPYTWTSADAAGLPVFPGLPATMKSPAAKSSMPCASLCNTAAKHSRRPHRIGRPPPPMHWPRPWVCACA
jgi:hypothetical protein